MAQLQDRLRALGQLLEPLPPLPPPPPPPPALTGDRWYAYRTMWELEKAATAGGQRRDAGALAVAIVATEDGSLLKRSFNHSTSLPPADVRKYLLRIIYIRIYIDIYIRILHTNTAYIIIMRSRYEKGQRVALKVAPAVAKGESDYWLVEVLESRAR